MLLASDLAVRHKAICDVFLASDLVSDIKQDEMFLASDLVSDVKQDEMFLLLT
jgi:hypothetical protein